MLEIENKETLEEAAENYNDDFQIKGGSKAPHIKNVHIMNHFIKGAKWQQERMYSEEDMKECWNAAYIDALSIDEETYKPLFYENFIEQYKKK